MARRRSHRSGARPGPEPRPRRPFEIQIAPAPEKVFAKLPKDLQQRLRPAIFALADDPRPPGCKKMQGRDELWWIRVGDYRVIYRIEDDQLIVLVIELGHRRDIYRRP